MRDPRVVAAASVGSLFHIDPRLFLTAPVEEQLVLAAACNLAIEWKTPLNDE